MSPSNDASAATLAVSHAILASVAEIRREDWHRLFGDITEGYEFFQILESAQLEGFGFRYVLVYEGGNLELIAPLFWSDLDLGIGIEGVGRKILQALRRVFPRLLIERTLFCGSPFGENGVIGLGAGCRDRSVLLLGLVRAMEQICREKKLRMIMFKDFPAAAHDDLASLIRQGFITGDSFPNIVLPLPYTTMDDYLADLGRATRKDLRRKLRKASSSGIIEVRVVHDVESLIDPVYELYLNTYNAGTVRFEKLTKQYFLNVGRLMRDRAVFFLFYLDGRLVCFNLCFRQGGHLIDKFIGMDYSIARRMNLYFYTWHHNVEYCIRNGIDTYQVGQTDHDAKIQLGGKPVPLYFYARHNNRLVNALLRLAARFLAPRPEVPPP